MKIKKSSGCVLDVRMEEGYDTIAYDSSRYGNDGTLTGCKWVENGLEFNGTSDYVDCGNDASLNITDAVSVSFWMKCSRDPRNFNQVPLTKGIFNGATIAYNFYMGAAEDSIRFNVGPAKYAEIAMPSDMVEKTYFLVGTYDGSQINIYLDAVLGTPTAYSTAMSVLPGILSIGQGVGGGFGFNGSIDEVRIYNYALNASEIKQQYDATKHRYL